LVKIKPKYAFALMHQEPFPKLPINTVTYSQRNQAPGVYLLLPATAGIYGTGTTDCNKHRIYEKRVNNPINTKPLVTLGRISEYPKRESLNHTTHHSNVTFSCNTNYDPIPKKSE